MTIRSKPITPEYAEGWERTFAPKRLEGGAHERHTPNTPMPVIGCPCEWCNKAREMWQ
jgi:hypothetical protein